MAFFLTYFGFQVLPFTNIPIEFIMYNLLDRNP